MLNLELLAFVALTLLTYSVFAPLRRSNHHATSQPEYNACLNHLPPELMSEVFRHLHDHEMTLRSCSLVCKTWVLLSRYHLFYRIHLNHANAPAFVALLKSQSGSTLSTFVRQVTIHRELSHPPWMKETLPVLSSYLHPTSLYLNIHNTLRNFVTFESEGFPTFKEDLSVFSDVFQDTAWLSLSLDCDTFSEGVHVVCAFPLLETLELRGDWFHGRQSYVPSDTPCLPAGVRSIACFQGGSPFFLWLLRQPHPPSISSLSLRDTYVTETIRSYLQTLGGTLQHLSFEPMSNQSTGSSDIDISHNVGLRSIAIHSQMDIISPAFQLLSQVRSSDIEEVVIEVTEHGSSSDLLDLGPTQLWSRLDMLLSTPRFSKLRNLTVTMPWSSIHEIGKNLLPVSNARGVLHVPSYAN